MKAKQTKKPDKMIANRLAQLLDAKTRQIENAALFQRDVIERLLHSGSIKDINHECGYPDLIEARDYKDAFDRNGVATRVVSIYPEECFSQHPEIYETEDEDETEFERQWKELNTGLNIVPVLCRLDIMSGIGRFGVLLLGIDDGLDLRNPVEGLNETTGVFKENPTPRKLLYVKPFDESCVQISKPEMDVKSPRYGMPVMYSLTVQDYSDSSGFGAGQTLEVHWSRIVHIADNRLSSDIYGVPRLQKVFNFVEVNLKKLLGASPEMFWKNGTTGVAFETAPEVELSAADVETYKDMFEDYGRGQQKWLAVQGGTIKTLGTTVSDVSPHADQQLKIIAMSIGVPYRVFLGTEEGKMASGQDKTAFDVRVQGRCLNYITPFIIKPTIDRFISLGILVKPEEYSVEWPDRIETSPQEKMNLAVSKTGALVAYANSSAATTLIPPQKYLTGFLDFTDEEAESILEEAEEIAADKEAETPEVPPTTEEPEESEEEEDVVEEEVTNSTTTTHGGAGSGNFGHAGRPGEVGGSGEGGGTDIKTMMSSKPVIKPSILLKGIPKQDIKGLKIRVGDLKGGGEGEAQYNPGAREITITKEALSTIRLPAGTDWGVGRQMSLVTDRPILTETMGGNVFGVTGKGNLQEMYMKHVVAHEVGHHVWETGLTQSQKDKIVRSKEFKSYSSPTIVRYQSYLRERTPMFGDRQEVMDQRKIGREKFAEMYREKTVSGKFSKLFKGI